MKTKMDLESGEFFHSGGKAPELEENFKKFHVYSETIRRMKNGEFWREFKKIFKIGKLSDLGIEVLDLIELYISALEGKVNRLMAEAINPCAAKELRNILAESEHYCMEAGNIRRLLKTQERRLSGMMKEINKALAETRDKPKPIFSHSVKPIRKESNFVCPYCHRLQSDEKFEYGSLCKNCGKTISSPWEEHTICPNPKCGQRITRREIFEDQTGYELDTATNQITCGECGRRFSWKKHSQKPMIFGPKCCINCDNMYIPNPHNWRKQRICQQCKDNGKDPFLLDHPNYQAEYRRKMKKKKAT